MGYIYKITNKVNNKCYIGKTERTIGIRWKEHLRHSDYVDIPLYRAMRKYGKENFEVIEIEQCENSVIDEREIFWIKHYRSYGEKTGYNCSAGGEGGIQTFEEDIDDIITRYLAGERLDLLCKEYHHSYKNLRPKLIERGIQINTHAGPQKLSKQIYAIDPKTKQIIQTYNSIIEAARSICEEGKNPRAIANHIGKYKNTDTISHGYLWRTAEKELSK